MVHNLIDCNQISFHFWWNEVFDPWSNGIYTHDPHRVSPKEVQLFDIFCLLFIWFAPRHRHQRCRTSCGLQTQSENVAPESTTNSFLGLFWWRNGEYPFLHGIVECSLVFFFGLVNVFWQNSKPCFGHIAAVVISSTRGYGIQKTIKNARKKLETSVAPVMLCKIMKKNGGSGASNKIKTRLACILEANEPTRLRMGSSVPNHHEDHIAGKGENSLQHFILVHKFIPIPQSYENSCSKSSGGQGMGKSGEKFGVESDKDRSKKQVIDEARTTGAKNHFASLMDMYIWKMLNWRQSTKNTKVELYSAVIL